MGLRPAEFRPELSHQAGQCIPPPQQWQLKRGTQRRPSTSLVWSRALIWVSILGTVCLWLKCGHFSEQLWKPLLRMTLFWVCSYFLVSEPKYCHALVLGGASHLSITSYALGKQVDEFRVRQTQVRFWCWVIKIGSTTISLSSPGQTLYSASYLWYLINPYSLLR